MWADGRFGWLDTPCFLHETVPGHGLGDVFGCKEYDYISTIEDINDIITPSGNLQGYQTIQVLKPTTGEVRGNCAEHPVIVRNHYGAGVAELCGTQMLHGLLRHPDGATAKYLADFAREHGATPMLETPQGLQVARLDGPDESLFILSNLTTTIIECRINHTTVAVPPGDTVPCFA